LFAFFFCVSTNDFSGTWRYNIVHDLRLRIASLLLGNRRSSWSLVVDISLTTLLLLPFVLHKEDDLDDDNPLMMCILDIIGAGAKP